MWGQRRNIIRWVTLLVSVLILSNVVSGKDRANLSATDVFPILVNNGIPLEKGKDSKSALYSIILFVLLTAGCSIKLAMITRCKREDP